MMTQWPFEEHESAAVVVDSRVLQRSGWIQTVLRDAAEGGWQFLGPSPGEPPDLVVLELRDIVDGDPTVAAVAELPPGWYAWRAAPGAAWQMAPQGEELPAGGAGTGAAGEGGYRLLDVVGACSGCGRDILEGEAMSVLVLQQEVYADGAATVLEARPTHVFCPDCARKRDFGRISVPLHGQHHPFDEQQ